MSPSPAPGDKARLTLSQLASYDDVLTDALVDHLDYWTTIRKNSGRYAPTRGLGDDEIRQILFDHVVCRKDGAAAEQALLQLSGLRKFMARLRSPREREWFRRHLQKYLDMWRPDCPFEVAATNRYTIITDEAAVLARRELAPGQVIKYLCGTLVPITTTEERALDLNRKDFSIVMSSRKKTPMLFLGPARFANHDCQANAKLVTTGLDGMTIVAKQTIAIGEEITVTYGEDYFGIGNCECLCGTCEASVRSGWSMPLAIDGTKLSIIPDPVEESARPYSFRRKRKSVPSCKLDQTPASDGDAQVMKKRDRRKRLDRESQTDTGKTQAASAPISPSPPAPPGRLKRPRNWNLRRSHRRSHLALSLTNDIDNDLIFSQPASPSGSRVDPSMAYLGADLKSAATQCSSASAESSIPSSDASSIFDRIVQSVETPMSTSDLAEASLGEDLKRPAVLSERPSQAWIGAEQETPHEETCPEDTLLARRPQSRTGFHHSISPGWDGLDELATVGDALLRSHKAVRQTLSRNTGSQAVKESPRTGSSPFPCQGTLPQQSQMNLDSAHVAKQDESDSNSQPLLHQTIHQSVENDADERKTSITLPLELPAVDCIQANSQASDEIAVFAGEDSDREGLASIVTSNKIPSVALIKTECDMFDPVEIRTLCQTQIDAVLDMDSDSDLSSLASNEFFDDSRHQIIVRRRPWGSRAKRLAAAARAVRESDDRHFTVRYPGDYRRHPARLATEYARFVPCLTCDAVWPQPDGYLTRRECPRCERHSKLYGYAWPKTERLKGDPERVLDHRTVHRFIKPQDEAKVRKRGRGLILI